MSMSRKDYEAIAHAINEARWEATTSAPGEPELDQDSPAVVAVLKATRDMVAELSEVFEKDNPRFDRERFVKACGISDIGNSTGRWRIITDHRPAS